MTTTQIKVTGTARLRPDENDVNCQCCGRAIRNLAYMSNGQVWGRSCASKSHGKKAVEAAPVVLYSLANLHEASSHDADGAYVGMPDGSVAKCVVNWDWSNGWSNRVAVSRKLILADGSTRHA